MISACLCSGFEAERTVEPDWLPRDEAVDVFATNQRDVFAESLTKDLDQSRTMRRFLLLHLVEDRSGRGIRLAKAVGEIAINPAVLPFEGNCEREISGSDIVEVSSHTEHYRVAWKSAERWTFEFTFSPSPIV